jgi:hypothetical protein
MASTAMDGAARAKMLAGYSSTAKARSGGRSGAKARRTASNGAQGGGASEEEEEDDDNRAETADELKTRAQRIYAAASGTIAVPGDAPPDPAPVASDKELSLAQRAKQMLQRQAPAFVQHTNNPVAPAGAAAATASVAVPIAPTASNKKLSWAQRAKQQLQQRRARQPPRRRAAHGRMC